MNERPDYKTMTTEELQVAHSEMCAAAHDAGVEVPEELTVDFDEQEAGAEVCGRLLDLLRGAEVVSPTIEGLAEGYGEAQGAQAPEPKKKRARAKRAKVNDEPAADAAQQQESEVAKSKAAKKSTAKKAKGAKKVVAKKAATAKGKKATGNGVRPGSKLDILRGLLTRKSGCSHEEACKALGWTSVSMGLQANKLGLKMRREKTKDGVSRYYA
jgi:hypothetical protein